MTNVIIPSCGKMVFWDGCEKPRTQYMVENEIMIKKAADNFKVVDNKHFIFMFLEEECDKYATDELLFSDYKDNSEIIRLKNMTQGSLCSCLMAIDQINNEDELIISNNDHIIIRDMNEVLDFFREKNADCGVATFPSEDARWSYSKTENDTTVVIETAERRQISNQAIAGLYYFKKGSDFVECAKNAIRKGSSYNGIYFITAAVNEMILKNKNVHAFKLNESEYFCFYDKSVVEKYENR